METIKNKIHLNMPSVQCFYFDIASALLPGRAVLRAADSTQAARL